MDKYFETLKTIHLFKNTDENILAFLLGKEGGELVKFKKGDIICSRKSYKKCLSIILEGKVTVKKSEGGSEIIINTLGPGNIFGGAAVFNDTGSFIGTVTAVEKSTLLLIDQPLMSKLFRMDVVLAENYIQFLSESLSFLNKKIDTFVLHGTQERVFRYLKSQTTLNNGCVIPSYSMTKLARFLNIGRASLYRAFDSLEEKGLIEKHGKSITVFCENED
ncbi:MAG: Crp/Fnr family transcriptional regulator [Lachnospiraceae bacterium]|nr:Crp/Fnr family transcriptional regulator [Lachnospiraceae bacterium]